MDPLSSFVSLVLSSGPIGIAAGFIILIAVFAADKAGLVVSGDAKRIVNIVLGIALAGFPLFSSGLDHAALASAIASIGSALAYELLKFVGGLILG